MSDTPEPSDVRTSFRDALAQVIRDDGVHGQSFGPPPERSTLTADDVIAAPEMQAIRAWMRWAWQWLEYIDDDGNEPQLPNAVVAWVDP